MKTALITGSSRGIGRAIAVALASDGFNVAINYNSNEEEALTTKKLCCDGNDIKVGIYKADVSDRAEMTDMFRKIEEELGAPDVLVNNAGVAGQLMFSDIDDDEWDRIFDINVKGTYIATQLALPHMIHNKYGKIINISSMWGITGGSCEVHYSASKAAVIGMTKALAKELGPSNINVNCIAPGVIYTDMNKNLTPEDYSALADETPLMSIGQPTDIAKAASFLASDDSSFITGQVIAVDGGLTI